MRNRKELILNLKNIEQSVTSIVEILSESEEKVSPSTFFDGIDSIINGESVEDEIFNYMKTVNKSDSTSNFINGLESYYQLNKKLSEKQWQMLQTTAKGHGWT